MLLDLGQVFIVAAVAFVAGLHVHARWGGGKRGKGDE